MACATDHMRRTDPLRRSKHILTGLFLALWVVSCVRPPFPEELVLQHLPTIIAIGLLAVVDWRQPLSLASFVAVLAFLCLHLLGARYLYSNVPYQEWFALVRGHAAQPLAEWQRNHYDRLVHFCYGLLLVGVAREVMQKAMRISDSWAWLMALCAILASSAMYEILEWCIALALAPEAAEAYNGQQGDAWDAQKDMALALAGAVIAWLLSLAKHDKDPVSP